MKWYKTMQLSKSSDVLKFLNKLANDGVIATNIKLSSSTFGDVIYYYHTEEVYLD